MGSSAQPGGRRRGSRRFDLIVPIALVLLGLLGLGCELAGIGDIVFPDELPSPVRLSRPGVFFQPVRGDSSEEIRVPLTRGVPYRRLEVSFDVVLESWHSPLFHSVVALRRSGGPLYFGLLLRASNRRTIIDRGDDTEIKRDGPWSAGERYSLSLLYDALEGSLSFRARNRGREVQAFSDRISHRDLRDDGHAVVLVLGQRGVADGAFFPPWGWTYSNLEVRATP